MDITLKPAAEMRSRLLAIVKPENAFHFAVQFVGQMNRPSAAAIGAAIMFESLKVYAEGAVKLGYRASENHRPPCWAFLYDGEPVGAGELFYLLDIGGVSSELSREIFALDVFGPTAGLMKLLHVDRAKPPLRDVVARSVTSSRSPGSALPSDRAPLTG